MTIRNKRTRKNKRYDPNVPRKFFVNPRIPLDINQEGFQERFADNQITTSKYTVINFLPKNLFEQFRRIANFYFLCVCIIHFSINSPVSPVTSLLPLIFVVVVTGIKQGYEDWNRHKTDHKVNNTSVQILSGGKLKEIQRFRITVGDMVKVSKDEELPCDLLFLASSNAKSTCEITTANLDGETNLKIFHCPFDASEIFSKEHASDFSAIVECQQPHPNLYDFKGRMDIFEDGIREKSYSLNTNHLLLRGTRLKNTKFIYGCAVYTGRETKMALNSKTTRNKFSTAEITCNYYLIVYLVVLLIEVILTTSLKYAYYGEEEMVNMWYLGPITVSRRFKSVFQDGFSSFILYSYIIPISLYVTLELQKFLGSFFFHWDEQMKCHETGEYAICNTSDLNEELGQVKYLFSDKTGTLTENSMRFKQCSIAGVKFTDNKNCLKSNDNESITPLPKNILDLADYFLVTLSLCHTVKVKKGLQEINPAFLGDDCGDETELIPLKESELEYEASSPDEKALVEACASYGVVFCGEKQESLILKIQNKEKSFERLQILDFDSDRKLMSVIVRDKEDGQIWVLSKGAEFSIFKRCLVLSEQDEMLHDITMKHIDDFAKLGLRTLAIACKKMTEEEYQILSERLATAKKEIKNRDEEVRSIMDKIEKDFTLLGATGVEDLLQEGVQETLESFAVAKIKIWVLTGDKIETAVNVAYLCGLFKRFTTLIYLTHLDSSSAVQLKLEESLNEIKTATSMLGLIVDGISLLLLLEEFPETFYEIGSFCSAVVCCRMSPKQKAEVVKLIKHCSPKRMVCAAVGDGANDVSMIQEAHIGIGIMGKEGRQAVRCSDFSVARFRFLQRAFLVHGHWYYTRISTLILYCFYKNIIFMTPQVFFAFQSAYSTQSLYDSFVLTLYNVGFTSLPIIIFGLFEQVYPAERLVKRPYLYTQIRNNRNLSPLLFATWTLLGFWHAVVLYYGLWMATDKTPYIPDGKTQDIYLFGMMLTSNVIFVSNMKLMVESRFQTTFFFASIGLSIFFLYFGYLIFCSYNPRLRLFWTFYIIHKTPLFYFVSVILIIICLLPDFLINIVKTYNVLR